MRSKAPDRPADQLSLDLEPAFPRLPATLRPMLARPAPAPFDSPRHLFEPAWGGRRALAFVEAAVGPSDDGGWLTADGRPSVRIVDADGRDLLGRLPELRALPLRLDARSAVLDGEVVAVDGTGRGDAARLRARLGAGGTAARAGGARADSAGAAAREHGAVAFLVFDVLYVDGRPVLAQPLARRRGLLAEVLRPGPEVLIVPAIETDGLALHAAVVAQGLAGVRARVASSPYLPGVRSALWRSIRSTAEAPVPLPSEAAAEPVSPVAPVLAVMRRLPLDDPPAEPADDGPHPGAR